jgi:uncharacterized membrane protein
MQPPSEAATNAVTGLASRDRVRGFELAAGLSVLFMIAVHDLWHWGSPETWTTPIGTLISLLGGPTATPVFLFVMAASLAFSPGLTVRALVSRGAWLLFLGYVLNVLRGVIPATLGMAAGLVTQQQIWPFTPWWLLTSVDLHHVTGLSLILLGLLVRARPGWPWLLGAGVLAAAGPLLRGLSFGTPLLDGPLTPILGGAPNVYYAAVPWVVFPLGGAVFGRSLAAATPEGRARVFRIGGLLGLGLLAAGAALVVATNPAFDVVTYWRMPPAFVVGTFGIVLVWLALCDVVTRRRWLDRRLGLVYHWSDRVIPMYFMHWLVVGWGIAIVGFRDLALPAILVATPCAVVITTLCARFAIGIESLPWRLLGGRTAVPPMPDQRIEIAAPDRVPPDLPPESVVAEA